MAGTMSSVAASGCLFQPIDPFRCARLVSNALSAHLGSQISKRLGKPFWQRNLASLRCEFVEFKNVKCVGCLIRTADFEHHEVEDVFLGLFEVDSRCSAADMMNSLFRCLDAYKLLLSHFSFVALSPAFSEMRAVMRLFPNSVKAVPFHGRYAIAHCVMKGMREKLPEDFVRVVQDVYSWFAEPDFGRPGDRCLKYINFAEETCSDAPSVDDFSCFRSLRLTEGLLDVLEFIFAQRTTLAKFFLAADSTKAIGTYLLSEACSWYAKFLHYSLMKARQVSKHLSVGGNVGVADFMDKIKLVVDDLMKKAFHADSAVNPFMRVAGLRFSSPGGELYDFSQVYGRNRIISDVTEVVSLDHFLNMPCFLSWNPYNSVPFEQRMADVKRRCRSFLLDVIDSLQDCLPETELEFDAIQELAPVKVAGAAGRRVEALCRELDGGRRKLGWYAEEEREANELVRCSADGFAEFWLKALQLKNSNGVFDGLFDNAQLAMELMTWPADSKAHDELLKLAKVVENVSVTPAGLVLLNSCLLCRSLYKDNVEKEDFPEDIRAKLTDLSAGPCGLGQFWLLAGEGEDGLSFTLEDIAGVDKILADVELELLRTHDR